MYRKLVPLFVAVVVALVAIVPAYAITYGEPDGNAHPWVGGMVAEYRQPGQKDLICSGTLIAPTVFLTAAHCTSYLESLGISDVWVTFDAQFTATSTLYHGTMHTNPLYNQRQSDPEDIAVIVLDQAVTGITPAQLPAAGLFDRMKADGTLHGQTFTAVGYGVHEPVIGGAPPTWPDTNDRWHSTSSFLALNDVWLRLSQNNATGNGGTCYGDSGGPNFVGTTNVVGALTVTGDSMCLATNVDYRLDTPQARAFLAEFVALP